jgi:hypothetical protein
MVVLHCDGRKPLLPIHKHTQFSMYLVIAGGTWENLFGIFRSSAVAFNSMSSVVANRVPLRPFVSVGNIQKSLGTRVRWSVDYRNVLLGRELLLNKRCVARCFRDAETNVLATCRTTSSEKPRATCAKPASSSDQ